MPAQGFFDVAETEPFTQDQAIKALASAVGRRSLFKLPRFLLRFALQPEMRRLLGRSQRVTSQAFRDMTGWQPEVPNQTEGWNRIAPGSCAGDRHRISGRLSGLTDRLEASHLAQHDASELPPRRETQAIGAGNQIGVEPAPRFGNIVEPHGFPIRQPFNGGQRQDGDPHAACRATDPQFDV